MRRRGARRGKAEAVAFCERCGRACDARCRSDHLRDRAATRVLGIRGVLR